MINRNIDSIEFDGWFMEFNTTFNNISVISWQYNLIRICNDTLHILVINGLYSGINHYLGEVILSRGGNSIEFIYRVNTMMQGPYHTKACVGFSCIVTYPSDLIVLDKFYHYYCQH